MGSPLVWTIAGVMFGLLSGALYTWMCPRREQRTGLFVRASLIYTAIALAAIYVIFLVAQS